jgi:hypothetical protein
MIKELGRPAGNEAANAETGQDIKRGSSVNDSPDSLAFRADGVWRELAKCPPSALPWAALAYAAAVADANHARARQLGIDGFTAARMARPTLTQPRHGELVELRSRPPTLPCTAKCGRCSACVRAHAVTANMHRFGSPDWPGRKTVAA